MNYSNILDTIKGWVPEKSKVIDFGCGDGSLLRDLKLINQQMVDFIEEKNKESQNKQDSDKSESEKSDVDEESSSTA